MTSFEKPENLLGRPARHLVRRSLGEGGSSRSDGGWIRFRAAASPDAVLRVHLPCLALSGFILLAAFGLPLDRVQVCATLRWTGVPCLTCGLTRGFVAMAHGQWAEAWRQCPLAVLLYTGNALWLAWNLLAVATGGRLARGDALLLTGRRRWWILATFVFAVAANWMYRLALEH
ncbi:MAG: DUF2752 domain-containing protein [Lentisphaerae bacterium]|nr:DUF2752 domain-containing protein [Lentisphaerota bacterium]